MHQPLDVPLTIVITFFTILRFLQKWISPCQKCRNRHGIESAFFLKCSTRRAEAPETLTFEKYSQTKKF